MLLNSIKSLLQGNVLLLLLRIHTYLQGGGSRFLGDTDLALCLPFRRKLTIFFLKEVEPSCRQAGVHQVVEWSAIGSNPLKSADAPVHR